MRTADPSIVPEECSPPAASTTTNGVAVADRQAVDREQRLRAPGVRDDVALHVDARGRAREGHVLDGAEGAGRASRDVGARGRQERTSCDADGDAGCRTGDQERGAAGAGSAARAVRVEVGGPIRGGRRRGRRHGLHLAAPVRDQADPARELVARLRLLPRAEPTESRRQPAEQRDLLVDRRVGRAHRIQLRGLSGGEVVGEGRRDELAAAVVGLATVLLGGAVVGHAGSTSSRCVRRARSAWKTRVRRVATGTPVALESSW